MADDTTCKGKEKIDIDAKGAKDLIEKLLNQKPPQDLELGLKDVKKFLDSIEMDNHSGSREFTHTGMGKEFSHTGGQ
jgi:hypothetical protein